MKTDIKQRGVAPTLLEECFHAGRIIIKEKTGRGRKERKTEHFNLNVSEQFSE